MQLPEGCPYSLYRVMRDCWEEMVSTYYLLNTVVEVKSNHLSFGGLFSDHKRFSCCMICNPFKIHNRTAIADFHMLNV